jgi:hypothetical protein
LTSDHGSQHPEKVLVRGVDLCTESGLAEELDEQGLPLVIGAGSKGLALAHLPAVAVGRGADSLEAAVVTSVAGVGTLGAAAQGTSQTTRTTLKDILDKQTNKQTNKQTTKGLNKLLIVCTFWQLLATLNHRN